jgi:hypothetical protein
MLEAFILKHINEMFNDINREFLVREECLLELNSMRNTQPPEKPTFILNQKDVKGKIINKFTSSYREEIFAHVLLSGLIGDGKTHFINRIFTHYKNENNFIIKFRVEDTERTNFNFVKMILSELFSQYYLDFKYGLHNIINKFPYNNKPDSEEDILSYYRREFFISDQLSQVLYKMKTQINLEGPILRILGASHGKTELKKLQIDNGLNTEDYLDILRLFVLNKTRKGQFIIMLDEFEHAHVSLKPTAKKSFFQGYKRFIDAVTSSNEYKQLTLVTAITEQYEGELKNSLNKDETALWSRLEPNLVRLSSFVLSTEELNQLLSELSYRYEKAYDIHFDQEDYKNIYKALRRKFRESQPRSYRSVVSTILYIMDEIRYGTYNLEEFTNSEKKQSESKEFIEDGVESEFNLFSYLDQLEADPKLDNNKDNSDFKELIEAVKSDWKTSKHRKVSKIKTSLEIALLEKGYKIGGGIKSASVLNFYKGNQNNILFVTYSSKSRSTTESFNTFLSYIDSLDEELKESSRYYFLYPAEYLSNGLNIKFEKHPNIKGVSIELSELYFLLGLRIVESEDMKLRLINNLKNFYNVFE